MPCIVVRACSMPEARNGYDVISHVDLGLRLLLLLLLTTRAGPNKTCCHAKVVCAKFWVPESARGRA